MAGTDGALGLLHDDAVHLRAGSAVGDGGCFAGWADVRSFLNREHTFSAWRSLFWGKSVGILYKITGGYYNETIPPVDRGQYLFACVWNLEKVSGLAESIPEGMPAKKAY